MGKQFLIWMNNVRIISILSFPWHLIHTNKIRNKITNWLQNMCTLRNIFILHIHRNQGNVQFHTLYAHWRWFTPNSWSLTCCWVRAIKSVSIITWKRSHRIHRALIILPQWTVLYLTICQVQIWTSDYNTIFMI